MFVLADCPHTVSVSPVPRANRSSLSHTPASPDPPVILLAHCLLTAPFHTMLGTGRSQPHSLHPSKGWGLLPANPTPAMAEFTVGSLSAPLWGAVIGSANNTTLQLQHPAGTGNLAGVQRGSSLLRNRGKVMQKNPQPNPVHISGCQTDLSSQDSFFPLLEV